MLLYCVVVQCTTLLLHIISLVNWMVMLLCCQCIYMLLAMGSYYTTSDSIFHYGMDKYCSMSKHFCEKSLTLETMTLLLFTDSKFYFSDTRLPKLTVAP